MDRTEFAKALLDLANFIDTHDELGPSIHSTVNIFVSGEPDEAPTMARVLAPCDKEYEDDELTLTRHFGDSVHLSWFTSREGVCTAKVVGKRVETQRVQVAPPTYEDRDVEVDVIEWECTPLLALDTNIDNTENPAPAGRR